ncbi:MAG TPA: hypothetical protein VL463_11325 [Kofleriaceae bacterium]|nr:hypothetical protein [Kofleriaceae bacterium]
MKHLAAGLILVALGAAAHVAHADDTDIDVRSFDYLDVVETSDGSVWKGIVVEQTPGVQYKLVTSDGSVHVIKAGDVVKLTKQRNPWRQPTPMANMTPSAMSTGPMGRGDNSLGAEASTGPSLPAPYAHSGLRAQADLAIEWGTGDMKNVAVSFAPNVRIGYEQLYGNFGLEAGGMLRWTDWRAGFETDDMIWTLETQAYGRAALHVARAAPYAGVAIGTDINYVYSAQADMSQTNVGFGMNLQFGLPVAITPGFALELGGDYHPGTDTLIDGLSGSVSYFALRLGGQGRF